MDKQVTPKATIEATRPRNDNVLVRVERQQMLRQRESLIELPDTANAPDGAEALLGRVLAVGPGYYPDRRLKPDRPAEDDDLPGGRASPTEQSPRVSCATLVPTTVRVGERVLIDGGLAGEQLWDECGSEYRVVRECEILGVVE